ncbi:MAG: hypothetical protein ACLVKN_17935 [Flavonifractor plautii]
MVYQEGIYVGYRYTETRYEDAVLGTAGGRLCLRRRGSYPSATV